MTRIPFFFFSFPCRQLAEESKKNLLFRVRKKTCKKRKTYSLIWLIAWLITDYLCRFKLKVTKFFFFFFSFPFSSIKYDKIWCRMGILFLLPWEWKEEEERKDKKFSHSFSWSFWNKVQVALISASSLSNLIKQKNKKKKNYASYQN